MKNGNIWQDVDGNDIQAHGGCIIRHADTYYWYGEHKGGETYTTYLVSGAAVNKAVKLLVERGYIYEDGKHLYLTEEGKQYAETVYEKHCIIRDYLIHCGVSVGAAEEDACNMEHLITEETFTMMKKTLNK